MLKVAILDDVMEICTLLEEYIVDYCKSNHAKFEVDIYNSSTSLINCLDNGYNYNLIFLDIKLKEVSGIEVGKYIRENLNDFHTEIVYISSDDKYSMNLFKLRPMDFLIKPIKKEDVNDILKFVLENTCRFHRTFQFKMDKYVTTVELRNIIYFESSIRVIYLYCTDFKYTFYKKLTDIENELSNYGFIRIHASYLINYDKIKSIKTDKVIMSNDVTLNISKKYRNSVKEYHLKYAKEQANNGYR